MALNKKCIEQSKQNSDSGSKVEEERLRRNCFVAITRTIKTLILSYAERYRGWAKQPSRFLYEIYMKWDC
jgi:DNA helicase-2/ATP-dependent DNA helicase PcrA